MLKNPKGFFLMVEAGRIDHAHHESMANRALSETLALEKAVVAALDVLGSRQDETLMIVTADHAHTMSISGYAEREADIRGDEGIMLDGNEGPFNPCNSRFHTSRSGRSITR